MNDLTVASEDPHLWNNPEKARQILQEIAKLKEKREVPQRLDQRFTEWLEFYALAESDNDTAMMEMLDGSILVMAREAKTEEMSALLSGEADGNSSFLEIHAGAGGTESHDWALMLFRMYTRWAEKRGYAIEVIDMLDGEEAGIKSATLKLEGYQAYGWAKSESGVHRLVRMSPFNSAGKRQTSFASVWVYPVVDQSVDIVIAEKDCRIDTYRASGAGGQHVNKTESAVRITHLPTNIVVQCQTDRSQHRNRAECFAMLKARLYALEMQKREAAAAIQEASKTDNGWGHQIRSYVLQPYQLVKDLRTQREIGDAHGVLDGDLDELMTAYLEWRVASGSAVADAAAT